MSAITGFLPTFRENGVPAVVAHLETLRGKRLNGDTLTEAELDWMEYVEDKLTDWMNDAADLLVGENY